MFRLIIIGTFLSASLLYSGDNTIAIPRGPQIEIGDSHYECARDQRGMIPRGMISLTEAEYRARAARLGQPVKTTCYVCHTPLIPNAPHNARRPAR